MEGSSSDELTVCVGIVRSYIFYASAIFYVSVIFKVALSSLLSHSFYLSRRVRQGCVSRIGIGTDGEIYSQASWMTINLHVLCLPVPGARTTVVAVV